jgi:hypothetical protein
MDLYNKYEHFCNVCNHVNKDKYNTFIINTTQKYKLNKKRIEFSGNDRQYCFKKEIGEN